MRYLFVSGVAALVLATGLAFIQSGAAFGQQPRNEFVPTRTTYTTSVVVGQQNQAEEDGDETAKLNARDAELGQQAESLVKQLAEATDEKDRAKLKQSLEETLTQQFDTQQKVRELEVAAVEARVKKLRDTISKRNQARRTIIDKRLDQLLREAEGLGWNSPSGGPIGYGKHVQSGFISGFGSAGVPRATIAPPRVK